MLENWLKNKNFELLWLTESLRLSSACLCNSIQNYSYHGNESVKW